MTPLPGVAGSNSVATAIECGTGGDLVRQLVAKQGAGNLCCLVKWRRSGCSEWLRVFSGVVDLSPFHAGAHIDTSYYYASRSRTDIC